MLNNNAKSAQRYVLTNTAVLVNNRCNMDKNVSQKIANWMKSHKNIEQFNIAGASIKSLNGIAKALEECVSIKRVCVTRNGLDNMKICKDLVDVISTIIATSKNLERINICHDGLFGKDFSQAFIDAFSRYKGKKALDVDLGDDTCPMNNSAVCTKLQQEATKHNVDVFCNNHGMI